MQVESRRMRLNINPFMLIITSHFTYKNCPPVFQHKKKSQVEAWPGPIVADAMRQSPRKSRPYQDSRACRKVLADYVMRHVSPGKILGHCAD